MAEFIVSPVGRDEGVGTLENPMSNARACGALGVFRPRGRDKFFYRGGIWAGTFEPRVSGEEGAPIWYGPYPGEVVHWDGSAGARSRLIAGPDAWSDVPRETGFEPVAHRYQPRNKSGGAVGEPRDEANVYRKSVSGGLRGVFVDAYREGLGLPLVAGRFTSLWDVGVGNYQRSNPGFDLHDYDAAHDQFNGRPEPEARQHGPESQWKLADGSLRLRVYGPDWNPNNHAVYCAVREFGMFFRDVNHITVEGDGRWRVWRAGYNVKLERCRGIRLVDLDVAFAAQSAFHCDACEGITVEGGRYVGGGSFGSHSGEGFWPALSRNVTVRRVWVSDGGHSGIWLHKLEDSVVEECEVRDAGGHGVGLVKGCARVTVRGSRIHRNGRHQETLAHKVDHLAGNIPSAWDCVFEENDISGGAGVGLSSAGSAVTQRNVVRGNVFRNLNGPAILLTTFSEAPARSCRDNLFVDNVVENAGSDRGYGGPSGVVVYVELRAADAQMDGNRIRGLTVRQPGVPAGGDPKAYWVWSHPDGRGVTPGTVAEVERVYPGWMSGVRVEAYEPGGGEPLPPPPPVPPAPSPVPPPPVPPPPLPPPAPSPSVGVIHSVAPSPVLAGRPVMIHGSGLPPVARVLWATGGVNKAAAPTMQSPAVVACVAPEDVIGGELYLRFQNGLSSNALVYSVAGEVPEPVPEPEPVRVVVTRADVGGEVGLVGVPARVLDALSDLWSGWFADLSAGPASVTVLLDRASRLGRLRFQVARGSEGRAVGYEVHVDGVRVGAGTATGEETIARWVPRDGESVRLTVLSGGAPRVRVGGLELWSG